MLTKTKHIKVIGNITIVPAKSWFTTDIPKVQPTKNRIKNEMTSSSITNPQNHKNLTFLFTSIIT